MSITSLIAKATKTKAWDEEKEKKNDDRITAQERREEEIILPQVTAQENSSTGRNAQSYVSKTKDRYLEDDIASTITPKVTAKAPSFSASADLDTALSALRNSSDTVNAMYNDLGKRRSALDSLAGQIDAQSANLEHLASNPFLYQDSRVTRNYVSAYRDYQNYTDLYRSAAEQYNDMLSQFKTTAEQYNADMSSYRKLAGRGMDLSAEYNNYADTLDKEAKDLTEESAKLLKMLSYGAVSPEKALETRDKAQQYQDQAKAKMDEAAAYRQKAQGAVGSYYAIMPYADDYDKLSKAVTGRGGNTRSGGPTSDSLYNFINDVQGAREAVHNTGGAAHQYGEYGEMTPYSYMSDDEIATYNYLYAKKGKEDADKFLDYIHDSLNAREGKAIYDSMSGVERGLYWIPQGIDQWASGMRQLFHSDALPTSAVQYAGQNIQQGLQELGLTDEEKQRNAELREAVMYGAMSAEDAQKEIKGSFWGKLAAGAYGLGTTISNMAPSIMVSYMTGGLLGAAVESGTISAAAAGRIAGATGSALMGGSAGGNAYNMKLKEGWTKDQARTYGMLVAASETMLQYFLGGIDQLGGALAKKGEKALSDALIEKVLTQVSKMDGVFAKTALEFGSRITVKGLSEGIEEGLQEILEPIFAKIIHGDDIAIDWGNVTESFIMGFLASGILDAPNTLVDSATANKSYRVVGDVIRKNGDAFIDEVIQTGIDLGRSSEVYELALDIQQKLNNGKTISSRELGELFIKTKQQEGLNKADAAEQPSGPLEIKLPGNEPQQTEQQQVQRQPVQQTDNRINLKTYEQQSREQRAAKAGTELERTGILAGAADDVIARTQRVSDALGVDAVFYYKAPDANGTVENGFYDGDGVLHINAASKNPVTQILSHEFTHRLEGTEGYDAFAKQIVDRLKSEGRLDSRRAEIRKTYSDAQVELDRTGGTAQVDREIVAEYIEKEILTDESRIRELVQVHRGVFQRIMDTIDNILAKLGNENAQERVWLTNLRNNISTAMSQVDNGTQGTTQQTTIETENTAPNTEAGESIPSQVDNRIDLQRAEPENAETSAQIEQTDNGLKLPGNEQTDQQRVDDVMKRTMDMMEFSISRTRNMPWEDQVKGYFDKNGNIKSSDMLYLGTSGNRFGETVADAPLAIPLSVVSKGMRKSKGSRSAHELTKNDIRNLKSGIENAPAVIYNPARNALVYLTNNKDSAGNYIIAAFDIDNVIQGETVHEATTIHGRENIPALLKRLGKDATVFVKNENELNEMLPGNQILKSLELLASVELIGDNISEEAPGVNREIEGPDNRLKLPGNEREHSISARTAEQRKDVVQQLRGYLNGDISKLELKRYIDTIDSGESVSEDTAAPETEADGAQEILDAARRERVSVNEYLRRNWEQYEYDGELNEDARRALEMERQSGRRHSISGPAPQRDAEYLQLAKDPEKNEAQLARMVEQAARAAGYDMHLYHGSRAGGGFTVFKNWQYFTENRAYAERYQQRDNPGSMYEVYAKSERMFDTRNDEAREIFKQYRGEYGMGELQDSGLPDWTDGYDISDIIEENDLDYDGIVLDEGGDMVDGKPVKRGVSYVLRASEQVKSADPVTYDDNGNVVPLSERFNPENEDIRYSISEAEGNSKNNYTYDKLISKGSLKVVPVQTREIPTKGKKLDSSAIAREARKKASTLYVQEVGGMDRVQRYIYVPDISANVLFQTEGIRHGLQGNKTNSSSQNTATITYELANILRNSIAINELKGRAHDPEVKYAHVLIGFARSENGQGYIVRSTINHMDRNKSILARVEIFDILKGAKAKKIESEVMRDLSEKSGWQSSNASDSTIKIADLLDIVKDNYPEFLSKDVMKHYGLEVEQTPGVQFSISRNDQPARNSSELLDLLTDLNPDNQRTSREDIERMRQKDLDEFWESLRQAGDILEPRTNPDEKVSTRAQKQQRSAGDKARDAWSYFKRKMVDSGEAVTRIGKAVRDPHLYHYYNMARASSNAATSMIMDERTDIYGHKTGKGLNEIMETIREKGEDHYKKLQLYLFHMHNIDRMSRFSQDAVDTAQAAYAEFKMTNPELSRYTDAQIERMAANDADPMYFEACEYMERLNALRRAENKRNKPVFGFDVSAEDSKAIADQLLRENPEFADEAQEIYDYIDNLLRYRVDSGLITEDDYQTLKQIYPHYVPTFRTFEKESTDTRQRRKVQIGSTIKRATGGTEKLMPLHKALAQQTMSVVREGSKNRFGQRLLNSNAQKTAAEHVLHVQEYESDFAEDSFDADEDEKLKKQNTFVVREGGKQWEMTVSPALFEAVTALSPVAQENNFLTNVVRKGNSLFKELVTGYNPTFLVRNFMRDLQDAGLYSKDLSKFAVQYPQAVAEIAKDGEYWRQYKALGGTYSTIFDYETGEAERGGWLKRNTLGRIESLNMAVEQAPRLAEFMATVKKAESEHGKATMDDLMEAMYNAADVTVNFGRSGTLGKVLNANYVPFLNPGIQGFDKMIRNVTETKGAKNWARLAIKAAVLGIAPTLLNALLYHDEDDWDEIKDRDKDIYYLFKLGDHTWLKLPKGRTLSLLGMAADRAIDLAKGEDVDWAGVINTAASQVAPANPLENNILQPVAQTKLFSKKQPGQTWYGTEIENQRLQSYAPGERYDASTDIVSKWLGKTFNLSPKKINYLLDQYSGVVGDMLLPLLTPTAERDMFTAAFTIDTTRSNRLSNDFYEMADELQYAKNGLDATGADAAAYRYWTKQSTAISEVNKAIREIEADETLSDKDKRELSRTQYAIRNALMKNAMDSYEQYAAAAEKYYYDSDIEDEDDRVNYAYREANREVLGAEYALKTYNKDVYETAQQMKNEGISYDDFYDFYFDLKDITETGYEGSNAKRDLISGLNMTDAQKEALYKKYVSDSRDGDIEAFKDAGLDFDTFLDVQNEYAAIDAAGGGAGQKRTELARWLNEQDMTSEQQETVLDSFKYYSHIPASQTKYEQFVELGIDDRGAYDAAAKLSQIDAPEGKNEPTNEQKWRAIVDSDMSVDDQLKALETVTDASQYRKFKIAYSNGIDPAAYVTVREVLPQYNADGNGSYKNAEIEAAIDSLSLPLTNAQRAVLWQLLTGSTSGKNNPYSSAVGWDIVSAVSEMKEAEKNEESTTAGTFTESPVLKLPTADDVMPTAPAASTSPGPIKLVLPS